MNSFPSFAVQLFLDYELDTYLLISVSQNLCWRLTSLLEKNNLFPVLQFGFRKGLGTCDALLIITNVVQKALDSGCKVLMVGLDYSAAFDRIHHEALTFKVRQLGLGGAFLSFLIKFLIDRVQRVVVDGYYSAWRNVIFRFSIGNVLGTLLFILYTHDMWFGL